MLFYKDMMAKLIKDMPEQPVPFLIKILKKHSPEDNVSVMETMLCGVFLFIAHGKSL